MGNLKQCWQWAASPFQGISIMELTFGENINKKFHRFASDLETSCNDQFFLMGSFTIPRDFLNGIDFNQLLQRKPLGQELTRFALETPWNDQIFLMGSFTIPRDFLNGIDFNQLLQGKPLGQELTRFALETPWNDQIFSCRVSVTTVRQSFQRCDMLTSDYINWVLTGK